ncbi:MAG: glycosyltransferase family 4 protein [Chloroflexi bacterium]|nr:glycosyltransferase family 4 protein [Chloroflexota bacterium]
MRILISTQTYAPGANGQAVFTTRLAEGLAMAGHEIGVLMPADTIRSQQSKERDVTLYRVGALSLSPLYPEVRLALASLRKVTGIMNAFRPDIVHLQDHYPLSWMAFQAAKRLHIPVMGTNHFLPENISRNLPIPRFTQGIVTQLLWQSWRITYDHLALLTTPTLTAARILQAQHVHPAVLPVSCGIDLSQFYPRPHMNRLTWRQKYGLAPHKPLFIFVGRVDHEKRLDVLLRAVQRLPDDDFQVAIVGKGLHLRSLHALSQKLALGNKVVFTGYLPAADLPFVLNSADIFVMPSEAELQSIATLEAMASGLPVLAANKHALPELVENGHNGYLFPPGDAEALAQRMVHLMAQRDRWASMGRASRQIAAHHDLAATIGAYQAIYRQVLTAAATVHLPTGVALPYDFSLEP